MKTDFLIVDGKNLLWRTYDAFKNLYIEFEDETIISTGGIYGFLTLLINIHNKYGGLVAIAWEGKNNFRYNIYSLYKYKGEIDNDRREILEDVKGQEKRIKVLLRAIGIRQYYGVNCEADDVMGNLANISDKKNKTTIIYTADSDLRQLVNKNIFVVSPQPKGFGDIIYDEKKVIERHGIKAHLLPDLKALSGDHSDNIPGVKGIGEKIAAKLINKFGDIESVIKSVNENVVDWPINKKFIEVIKNEIDNIRLYKKLTTIKTDCELKFIEPLRDLELVRKYLSFYRFLSLMYGNEFNSIIRLGKNG